MGSAHTTWSRPAIIRSFFPEEMVGTAPFHRGQPLQTTLYARICTVPTYVKPSNLRSPWRSRFAFNFAVGEDLLDVLRRPRSSHSRRSARKPLLVEGSRGRRRQHRRGRQPSSPYLGTPVPNQEVISDCFAPSTFVLVEGKGTERRGNGVRSLHIWWSYVLVVGIIRSICEQSDGSPVHVCFYFSWP